MKTELTSYRKIWDIGWPIAISLYAESIVSVTDTAFLGRVGEVALGGSAIGGLFYVLLLMVGHGFTTGVQILIARRFGEKDNHAISVIFDNGLYFISLISLLFIALIIFTGKYFLSLIVASHEIMVAADTYLSYRIFGLLFTASILLFRSLFTGIHYTRYLSIASIIMASVNIILDYGLIFGNFGLPEWGIKGAAIATAIAEGCGMLFLLIVIMTTKPFKPYKLFKWVKPQWDIIKSTLSVSSFVMLQFLLTMGVWFAFFIVIEKMGERELAISNIGRSVYMFLMIPAWALGSVTNTLVSNALGEKKPEKVLPLTFKIIRLSAVILLCVILPAAVFPHTVLGLFSNDTGLIAAAIPTYYTILVALFFFSLIFILFNAVLGTGNTKITLLIEVITLTFYMSYTWLIAIHFKQPLHIVWTAELVYAVFMGSLSYLYLKKGNWREIKI